MLDYILILLFVTMILSLGEIILYMKIAKIEMLFEILIDIYKKEK